MNEIAKPNSSNKAFVAFLLALTIFWGLCRNGFSFEEPSGDNSSSSADDFNAISKEIQQIYKSLGYSDDADIDLLQMVSNWRYVELNQSIAQSRRDYQQKNISADQAAQTEEVVLQGLCQTIRKEFAPASADSEYFYLSKAVKDKKAQFLGYAQLLYLLGTPLGLTVKVANVLEPASGPLPAGEEHAVCLIELTGGKTILVDLMQDTLSKPLVFREAYRAAGNYWELAQKDNPLKLPRRIQVLDKNGIVAEIYSNLGYAYAKSNKDTEAVAFLSKAIELNPKLAKAYSSRGSIYTYKGQRAKALADLEKAVEIDPKDAEAFFNFGTYNQATRDDAKALAYFSKAIELKPNFSEAYKNRANIYLRTGKKPEAIVDLTKTIELKPKDAEAHVRLGIIYSLSGGDDKALDCFNKALEINPKYTEGYNYRGSLYVKMKKYTDAISDFIKAIEINPKFAEAYLNKGAAYAELGQNEKAVTDLSKALEINPKSAEAYNVRGAIYLKLGKFTEARSDCTRAIQLYPKYAEAYFNRGMANANLKKTDEARRDMQKAMDLNPALKEQVQKMTEKAK